MSDPSAKSPAPSPVEIVEAMLFASDTPLEPERMREVLGLPDAASARALVDELRARYDTSSRGLAISEAGGGYRLVTRADVAPWLVRLARVRTRARLSRPALETLAIIGYRHQVSRPEIDAIRGVNSEGVIDNLLEKRLIRVAGRKDAPGRPFMYETTKEFLVAFGLRDLADLPRVDGELVVPEIAGDAAPEAADAASDDTPEMANAEAQTEQDPGAGGSHLPAGG